MYKSSDYLRRDIREYSGYAANEFGHNPEPEYSSSSMEMFYVEYKKVKWDFTQSIMYGMGRHERYGEINAWALTSKSPFYSSIGSDIAITGKLDFDFGELPQNIYKSLDTESGRKHLNEAWSMFVYRKYSRLNMSLTLMVKEVPIPMPKMIPVFLYNLNRYFAGKPHHLFYSYTDNQREKLAKYLDNAFIETISPNHDFNILDYCQKVLFIEDPQLIRALLDYGKLIELKEEQEKTVFENAEDAYKFINLVTWYWAEKEVNMLLTF